MKIKLKDFKVFEKVLLLTRDDSFWNEEYLTLEFIDVYAYSIPMILNKFVQLNIDKFTNEEIFMLKSLLNNKPEAKNKSNYIIAFHIIDSKPETDDIGRIS